MDIIKQSATLLWITPTPEWYIETAARLCYQSKSDGGLNIKFLQGLLNRGHESVIEHAVASFMLTTNRAIANELVRHRIASYSQVSTRYVNYKQGIQVIKPTFTNKDAEIIWEKACLSAETAYTVLIRRGEKPEVARDVLPLSLATQIIITANFREWRHIIKLRCSKAAHYQIRELISMVHETLNLHAPTIFPLNLVEK